MRRMLLVDPSHAHDSSVERTILVTVIIVAVSDACDQCAKRGRLDCADRAQAFRGKYGKHDRDRGFWSVTSD
jgi:hypothetical protein